MSAPIVNVPETKVNIPAPEITMPAPVVNVPQPYVNVSVPEIHVPPAVFNMRPPKYNQNDKYEKDQEEQRYHEEEIDINDEPPRVSYRRVRPIAKIRPSTFAKRPQPALYPSEGPNYATKVFPVVRKRTTTPAPYIPYRPTVKKQFNYGTAMTRTEMIDFMRKHNLKPADPKHFVDDKKNPNILFEKSYPQTPPLISFKDDPLNRNLFFNPAPDGISFDRVESVGEDDFSRMDHKPNDMMMFQDQLDAPVYVRPDYSPRRDDEEEEDDHEDDEDEEDESHHHAGGFSSPAKSRLSFILSDLKRPRFLARRN